MPETTGWRILVNTCDPNNPRQSWTWNVSNGTMSAGGMCARVASGWVNGLVTAGDCTGDVRELWRTAPNQIELVPPPVTIQTAFGCLQVPTVTNNVQVETFPCNGDRAQQWRILGTGQITIDDLKLCLNGSAGEPVDIRACAGGESSQLWDLELSGKIRHSSNLLLTSDAPFPQANVSISTDQNTPQQIWTIVPVPPSQ
jgi:hypothetical protein